MIKKNFEAARQLRIENVETDLLVVGGGLSGVCAAITAARAGITVALVQDRPVLGGNASSEVRLWVLGATSHMGNNNRWAREGGVIDELLVENTFRNPEGNTILFDTVMLEKVRAEKKIQLFLNTAVYEVAKSDANTIAGARAFCSQNGTEYHFKARWFCDASGDGILSFLAGAPFRMGAESREEFGEKFAPSKEYGELLGHSIYFYSKDVGRPVKYVAPEYALKDITQIPRYKSFTPKEFGCRLWWIEYGGRLDTIHDTEKIKWELWKVVYGVWDYIKNSGQFPEAENLTLEWVGQIPGKRESRRFEGEYMLRQQDIVEQKTFADAVAFGGWSIDLHPADGVFSEKPGCNQWHSKGMYQIPLSCFYNKHLHNLFFAGRIISASHVAFGSSRVMGTCAHGAQAVGMAVALAIKNGWSLHDFDKSEKIKLLQQELLKTGHHIPNLALEKNDFTKKATIAASSEYVLQNLPFDGPWIDLTFSVAQMLPVGEGSLPIITLLLNATEDTELQVEWRISSIAGNHTPDETLQAFSLPLKEGEQEVELNFDYVSDAVQYVYVCLMRNENVSVKGSNRRVTGLLTVYNKVNKAVSNYGKQTPPEDIGVDAFEFWCPHRRPAGHNFGLRLSRPLRMGRVENLTNGIMRPTVQPNAWIADPSDPQPTLTFTWAEPQTINSITLFFDTDFDHPMESSLMGHPEREMPFCVKEYQLLNEEGKVLFEQKGNHQTVNVVPLQTPFVGKMLKLICNHASSDVPAAVFSVLME